MLPVHKVYNLSAGKSLPQWLAEAKKKNQRLGETVAAFVEMLGYS